MDVQRCLELLREIKDVSFATVDNNGLPQIRIVEVMLVEDEKLYFCTSRGKEFYRQLIEDGHVAIAGIKQKSQMIRVSGKAVKLAEHKKWIDRIFEENPFMDKVYPDESRYVLEAFCIEKGEIEFFDLGANPIVRERFSIGDTVLSEAGFFIDESLCIDCGKCERTCPQKCIKNHRINEKHCLNCGLCLEECPVGAVKKKEK